MCRQRKPTKIEMTFDLQLKGLVPATFTPMNEDGSLNLAIVPDVVDFLIAEGVAGLYVLGSTGEGVSLTIDERRRVAQSFVDATDKRLPVVIQVGHESLEEARGLAAHAQDIGADAVSSIPPTYFKPGSFDTLVDCIAHVAGGAPDLPFYYYHIPRLTGVEVDAAQLLREGKNRIPTLHGVKYSSFQIDGLQSCLLEPGGFNILFGADEMLLSALAVGAPGAVGSTYNYLSPLFNKVIESFESGNLDLARERMSLAAKTIHVILKYGGHPAIKATMGLAGIDVGPPRLPHRRLDGSQIQAMKQELDAIGFRSWS